MEFIKKHSKPLIGVVIVFAIMCMGVFLYNKSKDNYLRITGFTYFQDSLNIYTVRDDVIVPNGSKISLDGDMLSIDEFYEKLINTPFLIKQNGDKFYAKVDDNSNKVDEESSEVNYKDKKVKSFKSGDEYTLELPDFKIKSKVLSVNKEFTEFKLSNSKIDGWDNYDLRIGTEIKLKSKGDGLNLINSICDAINLEVE